MVKSVISYYEILRFHFIVFSIGFFLTHIEKSGIPIRPLAGDARARNFQEIDDLEEKITEHERKITQMNSAYENLQKRSLELTEGRHVLRETAVFFEEVVICVNAYSTKQLH